MSVLLVRLARLMDPDVNHAEPTPTRITRDERPVTSAQKIHRPSVKPEESPSSTVTVRN